MGVTRWFGLIKETAFNEAWGTPSLTILDIVEQNIVPEQNVNPVPSSYYPTSSRVVLGDFGLTGNLNTVTDTDMLGHLLMMMFGNTSEQQEAAYEAYQHMFWSLGPRTNSVNRPPSYKLELGEDEKGRRQLSGLVGNTLDLTFNRGEPGQAVINVIAATEVIAAWGTAPTDLPSDKKYIFTASILEGFLGIDPQTQGSDSHNQVWLGMDTGAPGIEGLSININNNIPDDWKRHGSRFLYNYMVQEQEITGTITFSFDSVEELRRYFGGGEDPSSITTPAAYVDPFPAIFIINMGVPPVTDATNYMLKIYFPKIVYTSYGKPQTRRDRATIEVAFKALIPDGDDSEDIYDFDVTPAAEIIEYNVGTVAIPAYETFLIESDTLFDNAAAGSRELAAMYILLHNGVTSIY